jgi:abhydrolase domain-containing protein 1/3
VAEARETENVSILTTSYGGHIGFMEGLFPTRYHFSDRLFDQFASAVFQNVPTLNSL